VRAIVVALLVLCASAARVDAQDGEPTRHTYRAVVDRVDLEPSALTGLRLRVYLSALTIGGQLLDLTESKSIKLYLGASELKQPFALGTYDGTHGDLAMVVLVQQTADFLDSLPMIADSLDRDLLAALDDGGQIVVLPYGETVANAKLTTVKSQRGKVSLATDNSIADPVMLDAVDRALNLLKKAKATPETHPLRKLVLVIGDGRDLGADRERVTKTGQRAAKEGVRIHTMAFSASDMRKPMLSLGELSKQSLGTFRWVRKATPDSWKNAIEQVRDEIQKQYVLTYFVSPEDDVATKKLKIVTVGRTEVTSNEMKVPESTCGGNACTTGYCANDMCLQYRDEGGRGILGWLLIIVVVVVGGVVVLGVVGYLMSRSQQPRPPPMYPGYVPGSVPPGMYQGQPGSVPPGMYPGQVPNTGPHYPPGFAPGQMTPPGVVVPPSQPPQKKQKKQKGPPAVAPGLLPNGRPIPALLVMSGPLTGQRFMLANGFVIGKQPGCHLVLPDNAASSQHAQIGMDPNGVCKLYDRGSTNGTYINNQRVTEMPLQHGHTIKIGSTDLRFLAE